MQDESKIKDAKPKADKGPLVVVTLKELVDKHGEEKGKAKYNEIAAIVKGGNPPSLEPDLSQYAPDLAIHSKIRSEVEALLS